MFVLPKIFGEHPQAKILEVFVDHLDEKLSIPDVIWLTDMSDTTVCEYVSKLLDEKILLKGDKIENTQFYCLNKQKQEVQMIVSLVNYIVSEKLAERLEERGLEPVEETEKAKSLDKRRITGINNIALSNDIIDDIWCEEDGTL